MKKILASVEKLLKEQEVRFAAATQLLLLFVAMSFSVKGELKKMSKKKKKKK